MAKFASAGFTEWLIFGCLVLLAIIPNFVLASDATQTRYACPETFVNVGRKCYHFSTNTGTWFKAYFSCNDLQNSTLTIFPERYDQRQLEHYLFRNKSKNKAGINLGSYWVGGFKDWKQKKWVYSDGTLLKFPSYKDIDLSGQDDWTCLLIDTNRKRWRAENCMEPKPYICETKAKATVVLRVVDKKVKRKITIDECVSHAEYLTKKQKRKCLKLLDGRNMGDSRDDDSVGVIEKSKPAYPTQPTIIKALGHICPQNWMSLGNQCYLLSKENVSWSEAHFNCGQINAKLAMIRSKAQDQKLRIFLNGFVDKQERWIGGRFNSRTGEWVWALNGKPLNYKGFSNEVMLNQTQTEALQWQALIMDPQYAYQWSFRNEMEKHPYICQVKGRTVKRLSYPRRPSATIEILPDRRYQRRNFEMRNRNRSLRRTNRNKRY